jgi:hypothetical protein
VISMRDTERRLAIIALMEMPDPPDMRRRHRLTAAVSLRKREQAEDRAYFAWRTRRRVDRDQQVGIVRRAQCVVMPFQRRA